MAAFAGWTMLNAPVEDARPREAALAGPTAARALAFFPLTMPLTTGPGTIAAAIALGANHPAGLADFLVMGATWLLVAGAVALAILFTYGRSATASRLIGGEGTLIVTRLLAFVLLCVGTRIVLTGVSDALRAALHDP